MFKMATNAMEDLCGCVHFYVHLGQHFLPVWAPIAALLLPVSGSHTSPPGMQTST